VQFEEYVKQHGKTDATTIEKHNAAVMGYNHSPETATAIRSSIGLNDAGVKDAVTLNMLDDLDELRKQVYG
jgi:hypothetical protein